jgi:hypothetical protein
MVNKSILIFFIIFILTVSCIDDTVKNPLLTRYVTLITGYGDSMAMQTKTEKEKQIYIKHVHIPRIINKLASKIEKLVRFGMNVDELGPPQDNSYGIYCFPQLGWVFNDGSLWFTAGITTVNTVSSLFYPKDKSFKRYNGFFDGLPYKFDRGGDSNAAQLWPVTDNKIYFCSEITVHFANRYYSLDVNIYTNDISEKKELKNVVLPMTGTYSPYLMPFGLGQQMDSKERVYLFLNSRTLRSDLKGKDIRDFTSQLQVLIYDINNDTLYQLYHPITDDSNKNEKVEAFTYCLGEDENIYYQLVTDKAYYIYKLTLLWDQPMEKEDYHPLFFEFYPELKKAFDAAN